jgi:hypothetical protein
MQTFLPYPDFKESARVLDRQRLGKQRVECYQIWRALTGLSNGWVNHPATKMWAGHVDALCDYYARVCEEWVCRGYRHNTTYMTWTEPYLRPAWLGNPDFHASHRSNLLRKDPVWYGQFGWTEPPDLPYVWPV